MIMKMNTWNLTKGLAVSTTHNDNNQQLVSYIGWVKDYGAVGSGSILRQANTQGLKVTEEKVLPFFNM